MIIQNNFNSKSVDANNDYTVIGKGSNSLDKNLDTDKRIRENLENPIIDDILRSDKEYEEDDDTSDNKWSFFS